ncbi:hypothetical protein [Lamprobacter modestohalophilus]|uniref:hypothetical protein n=1 Tax=Lamprobacter modestohalophilus TaxID=1064514 RepID=UPI001903B075|nr:hypothetical protein [Lamprobacter modestohalophilus]
MTIGTISHGTLRPQDLIPTFLDLARDLAPEQHAQLCAAPFGPIPAHAQEDDSADWWTGDDAQALIEDLTDVLMSHAPAYCTFGPHEGDGSDFGFWPDWWEVEGGIEDGEILKVEDLADVPDDWRGLALVTNDHGNATLYDCQGEPIEVWGVI